jgi:hypothetical protein
MLRFSPEWWAFWAGVLAVGLTVAAAIAGLVAWYFSGIASEIKDARTNTLELAISKQQERAAMAEKDLLEIQERARPRTLDPDARKTIIEWLQIGSHDVPISIDFVSGSTSEPYDFAKAIADTLRAAKLTIATMDGGPAIGNPPRGLIIRISDVGGVEDQARSLQSALNAAGLNVRLAKDRQVKAGEIWLRVGLKP